MSAAPPILLVGCGRMGGALLAGWRAEGFDRIVVVDPSLPALPEGVRVVAEAAAIPDGFAPAAVVLAVKPQLAEAVLPAYARFAAHALVVSIMAGRTLGFLQRLLGPAALVRAMPNTPAAIGQGITVACPGPGVAAAQQALCHRLLAATGEVAWVDEEALLDPVTAISGGGPAYVFLLVELLEQAGLAQGLPPPLARALARRTISGAGALLAASESEEAADLRRAVTSPKGTTERALAVLMAPQAWPTNLPEAIAAATARSRELAG